MVSVICQSSFRATLLTNHIRNQKMFHFSWHIFSRRIQTCILILSLDRLRKKIGVWFCFFGRKGLHRLYGSQLPLFHRPKPSQRRLVKLQPSLHHRSLVLESPSKSVQTKEKTHSNEHTSYYNKYAKKKSTPVDIRQSKRQMQMRVGQLF